MPSTASLARQLPTLQQIRAERNRRRGSRWPDVWLEQHFYEPETGELIHLYPFQRSVLRYAMQRDAEGELRFRTVLWSQPKKSGKTAISGAVGRWAAETWGRYQLVMFVGNDAGQAKERGFAALKQSIELTPGYDRKHRTLGDQWRLKDGEGECSNGSTVKAIAADYTGEAGANPSLTVYTELWGFIHEAARRFWAEMAPSPTRRNSMRWIETYAGYEGESELLWGLYESGVTNGRQLTAGELLETFTEDEQAELLKDGPLFAEAPNADDLVPCYVNDAAGIFAFWDSGVQSRRMPWQQGTRGAAYYANEAATQTPAQMQRLHLNEWVSGESPFIPLEWWDACHDGDLQPLRPGDKTSIVIALDAAVTNDCFGMVAVSRDPKNPVEGVALRLSRKWTPSPGKPIDFAEPKAVLREWVRQYNVAEIAYDPYQLHDMATQLRNDPDFAGWLRPFPQQQDRLKADKGLFDLIRDRKIVHDGTHTDMREHLSNANAKTGATEDSKLRMVKKSETRKIDLAVCLSMGQSECLRLLLA